MDNEARLLTRLERSLRFAGETHSLQDLIEALSRGEMQAHYNDRAIVVTEIAVTPRKRFVNVFAVAGELEGVMDLIEVVRTWAQAQGCEVARAYVRPGFERVLAARGWRRRLVLMEQNVEKSNG